MLSSSIPVLSLAIWLPVVFGLLLIVLGKSAAAPTLRWLALAGSSLSFLVTVPLITGFDLTASGMQFTEKMPWIQAFNVNYSLGIDGLSMWFIPLTALITVFVVVAGWQVIEDLVGQYMGAFLILSGLMVGVFSALDGLLFYVFFEATLIPMYLIIGIWGGPNRVYAAFKFFLYTLLGSLLTLVALIYLYMKSGVLTSWSGISCRCRWTHRLQSSSLFWRPLRSRCRCGQFTPGCQMRTSRRQRAAL